MASQPHEISHLSQLQSKMFHPDIVDKLGVFVGN